MRLTPADGSVRYKSLQRLNVKRAVSMMMDNYDLNGCFVKASAAAPGSKVQTAVGYGTTAVESLIQIIEYFPDKLVANDLSREQQTFVISALDSTSRNIDSFLDLMPSTALDAARAQVEKENQLNNKEYSEFNEEEIINKPA